MLDTRGGYAWRYRIPSCIPYHACKFQGKYKTLADRAASRINPDWPSGPRYANHQPLNRQSEQYACEGIELSVSTMADHVGACAGTLMPLHELIKANVFAAERIHGDDTTVPVLAKGKDGFGRTCVMIVRSVGKRRLLPRSSTHRIAADPSRAALAVAAFSRTVLSGIQRALRARSKSVLLGACAVRAS
jgi:hypothetical protein